MGAAQLIAAAAALGLVLSAAVTCDAARLGPQRSGLSASSTGRETFPEVLDADARIFLWRAFLTPEECEYLRMKAERRLERSGVVDSATGGSKLSDIRTSDGMFFSRAEDHVIEAIERRIAEWTLTPVWNGEGLQVLRYKKSQKYDAHWDFFFTPEHVRNGGNRWSTVLMYLHDRLDDGGETVFPKVPVPGGGINANFSQCARHALAVRPQKGDAILFHSMKLGTGDLEERSMHGACPVIAGEKWSMTKWIHAGHYSMGGDKYDKEYEELIAATKEFQDANKDREL